MNRGGLLCFCLLLFSACLSLPKSPTCYQSYEVITLEMLKNDEVSLCCESDSQCKEGIENAAVFSGEAEREELSELLRELTCDERSICSVVQHTEGGEMAGEMGIIPCNTDSDCPQDQECLLNQCVNDVEADDDFDGVPNRVDNCPGVSNAQQDDCDMNGLGDACDPAGPCGGKLSGQTVHFVELRRELPEPCIFLELEGTNLRTQGNSQGSFEVPLPRSIDHLEERRMLGFIGRGINSEAGECKSFDGEHGSVYQRQTFFTKRLASREEGESDLIQDLFIKPRARLEGRVLRDGALPNKADHGGIKVRAIGASRQATLTDSWGRFRLEGLEPGDDYLIVISSEGYESKRIEGVSLSEGQVSILGTEGLVSLASSGGAIGLSQNGRCQSSLIDLSCTESSSAGCGDPCGGGGSLPSSCLGDLICVPSQWGWGSQLSKSETQVREQKELIISLRVLHMPLTEGDERFQALSLSPTLLISPSFGTETVLISLQADDDEVIEQEGLPTLTYKRFRWSGRLASDDLYTFIVNAGDSQRILTGRYVNVALDESLSEDPREFFFDLSPTRTFDVDGALDEDRDGVLDHEDVDQDGDGVLDQFDVSPHDPYRALSPLVEAQESPELDSDDDGDGLSDLEEFLSGEDGLQSPPNETQGEQFSSVVIISGEQSRVTQREYPSVQRNYSSSEPRWPNQRGSALRFRVSPRASDDQADLKVRYTVPIRVPLELSADERLLKMTSRWSATLVEENCPLLSSEDPESATRSCIVKDSVFVCEGAQGLDYLMCSTEFSIDKAESPLSEDTLFSIFVVDHLPTNFGIIDSLSLFPPCDRLCFADHSEPQNVYGLLRRAFAVSEVGTCLFEESVSEEVEQVYRARPSLFRELMAECVALEHNGQSLMAFETCEPEPLVDEQGRAYALTGLSDLEWPVECDRALEGLSRWTESPSLTLDESCRTALRLAESSFTFTLQNSAGERVELSLPLGIGDLLGRCEP